MFYQNKLKTKVISKDLSSIPFEDLAEYWELAASQAVARAVDDSNTAYNSQYKNRQKKALARLDSDEASFEGEVELEYNPPVISDEEVNRIKTAAGNSAIKNQFLKENHISSFGVAILDQLMVLFSKHKLNTLGSEGKICGLQYLRDNFNRDSKRDIGIYRFVMYNSRGDYLSKQTENPSRTYCSLVPLILYAHKLYNGTPYSSWAKETLHFVVNSNLCDAMLCEFGEGTAEDNFYGLGSEELIELQTLGLMKNNKDGVLEPRSPTTTYSLYRLGQTAMAEVPSLAQIMILQTWCAHPTNRTKYMVLDPKAWDTMPPPLVNSYTFKSDVTTTAKPKITTAPTDYPW